MIDQITKGLEFQSRALALRAERQKVLAGNIANADTPNFKARDIDFSAALQQATAGMGGQLDRCTSTDQRHKVHSTVIRLIWILSECSLRTMRCAMRQRSDSSTAMCERCSRRFAAIKANGVAIHVDDESL